MGRIIPYIRENKIHVPNHQPDSDLMILMEIWGFSGDFLSFLVIFLGKSKKMVIFNAPNGHHFLFQDPDR